MELSVLRQMRGAVPAYRKHASAGAFGCLFHTDPWSPKADREELTLFCRFARHVASVRKMHLRVSGSDCEFIVNPGHLLFSFG